MTDDETMSAAEFSTEKLVETLERENWIDCCKHNEMIVNPNNSSMNDQHNFDFEYNRVTSEKSVKFLDIHIDQKLSFNEQKHLSMQKALFSLLCSWETYFVEQSGLLKDHTVC